MKCSSLMGIWFALLALAGAQAQTSETPERRASSAAPLCHYLTWQRSPTTTMTVVWQTKLSRTPPLRWRGGKTAWQNVEANSHAFPHCDRFIHIAEITGLLPGQHYSVLLPNAIKPLKFRTLAKRCSDERPLRFITGGDTFHNGKLFRKTLRAAANWAPEFIAFGGDLAYVNGDPAKVHRWYEWLDSWTKLAVTPTGFTIPVVCAIGNHEVRGGFARTPKQATFFHSLFPFPGRAGYAALDLNENASLLFLDSQHTASMGGNQAAWLRNALKTRYQRNHLMALYHVPAYSNVRSPSVILSRFVRRSWSPLFDEFGVDVAFENHEHTYKRSPRIRNHRIDPSGTLYLGNGAFGVEPRTAMGSVDHWWLEASEGKRHFIANTLRETSRTHEAVSETGKVFDRWPPGKDFNHTEDLHLILRDAASAYLEQSSASCVSYAVVHHGQPVLARAFGRTAHSGGATASPKTRFQAASLSKPVTALAILRLVEEGHFSLDTSIEKLLGTEVSHLRSEAHSDLSQVTVRRLLSHTAGINVPAFPGLPTDISIPPSSQLLRGMKGSHPPLSLASKPGDHFAYSGGGYLLLQRIIEVVTKKDFATAAEALVLKPMGMTASTFVQTKKNRLLMAKAQSLDKQSLPHTHHAAQSAAGLVTTPQDYARFLAAFVPRPPNAPNRPIKPRGGLLSKPFMDELTRNQVSGTSDISWGLGWTLPKVPGLREVVIAHRGINLGWVSGVAALPQRGLALVIMTNGDDPNSELPKMMRGLMARLVMRN